MMMNLERIEQECLSYLTQVANPLVPIPTLMAHINEDDECRGVSERDLTDFLRKHELFRVFDPDFPETDSDAAAEWSSGGIAAGPRVILVTRIPTQSEMLAAISDQIEKMNEALVRAQAEAAENGDTEVHERISEILTRTRALAGKFNVTL